MELTMKRVFSSFAACSAIFTFAAFGADSVWTGAAGDGNWGTVGNWSPVPANGNIAVFNDSAEVAIKSYWTNSAGTVIYPAGFKVSSGVVKLLNAGASGTPYVVFTHPYADVAENATLSISNNLNYFNFGTFHKRGKGLFKMCANSGLFGEHVWWFDVEAGTAEFDGINARLTSSNVIVRSGATLSAVNGGAINHSAMRLTLEAGSTLYLNNTENVAPANLQGAGDIVVGPDAACLKLSMGAQASGVFTGTFSTNLYLKFDAPASGVGKFVLQRCDQLANIGSLRAGGGLTFKSGITDVYVREVSRIPGSVALTSVYMQDENGVPVNFHAKLVGSGYLKFFGTGNLYVENDSADTVSLFQNCYEATGLIVSTNGAFIRMGEGASTPHNFDYSGAGIKGIYVDGGSLTIENYSTQADIRIPVVADVNKFGVNNYGAKLGKETEVDADILALSKPGETGWPFDVAGGKVVVNTKVVGTAGGTVSDRNIARVSAGLLCGTKSRVAKDTVSILPKPGFLKFTGDNGWVSFEVTDGEFYWENGNGLKNLFARGGRIHASAGAGLSTTVSALSDGGDAQFVFDGGTVVMNTRNHNDSSHNFQATDSHIVNYVTDRGGWLVTGYNLRGADLFFAINNAVSTCTNCVTDGGIGLYGTGTFCFEKPLALTGPMKVFDGRLCVRASQLSDDTKKPFGTGDMILRNAWIVHYPSDLFKSEVCTIDFPGALEFGGSSAISTRYGENYLCQNYTAGSLRRAGKGAVLHVNCPTGSLGTESTIKFDTALENNASGVTKLPILAGVATLEGFTTYDATDGLKEFADYSDDTLDGGATSIASLSANQTVNSDKQVYGVRFTEAGKSITVNSGKTLTVGNGTDPAIIIFNNTCAVYGPGTLNFGGSEGIFWANNTIGTLPHTVGAVLSGSGGVSYGAPALQHYEYKYLITKANTYTGGTYINGCAVWPDHADAFSSGDVYVGSGERHGGKVVFKRALTFANNFHVGGLGFASIVRNRQYTNVVSGVFSFEEDATVSGNVELTETLGVTRMGVRDGKTGTISGIVSGDKLQLYNPDGYFSGKLALTGANTYTGGTEIVAATMAIRNENALGTGEVVIDGGTLEFCNTEAMTLTNDLSGIGTVRFAGGNGVNFTGNTEDFSASLELASGNLTLTSPIPSFVTNVAITAGTPMSLTLDGSTAYDFRGYTIDFQKCDLTLEEGSSIDFGGKTVTVRRFTGDRLAVNGTVDVLKPKIFLLMIR